RAAAEQQPGPGGEPGWRRPRDECNPHGGKCGEGCLSADCGGLADAWTYGDSGGGIERCAGGSSGATGRDSAGGGSARSRDAAAGGDGWRAGGAASGDVN